MWYLYALDDPATGDRRYVGQTKHIARRYRDHLGARGDGYCARWVRSVCRNGSAVPVLKVLAIVMFEDEAKRLEREYIARLKIRGCRLTNMTDGGEGAPGYAHTPETKARMSEARRGEQNHRYGATHTPEACVRIRASNKAAHSTPESRQASRDHMKAVRATKTWAAHTRPHSEAAKAKMRAAKLSRALSPEHRAKISAALRARAGAASGG